MLYSAFSSVVVHFLFICPGSGEKQVGVEEGVEEVCVFLEKK